MNGEQYFDHMFFELNFLKSKVGDVLRAVEKMPKANRSLTSQLPRLNLLADRLSARTDKLMDEWAERIGPPEDAAEERNSWQEEYSELIFLKGEISYIIRAVKNTPGGVNGKIPPLLPRLNFLADHLGKSIGQLWRERLAEGAERQEEWTQVAQLQLNNDFRKVEPMFWAFG